MKRKLLNVQAGSPIQICLISKEKSLDIFNFMLFLSETKSWNSPELLVLGSPLK